MQAPEQSTFFHPLSLVDFGNPAPEAMPALFARARQAFEKEQYHQRKESQGHIEISQAVTEAQIRARRRVRATEKEHMQEQAQNLKLKQDYTNQWIARTFGTLAIKLPDEDIKRPTFPMCRIPADDVLQIHVQKWDQPN
ncbi:hypothetical protein TKK_0014106 [Trichogramma kaykai]